MSKNKLSGMIPSGFLFDLQCRGIIISIIIHVMVLLFLLGAPVFTITPSARIIEVSLETWKSSGNDKKVAARTTEVKGKQKREAKKEATTLSKTLPMPEEFYQNNAVSDQQEEIRRNLSPDDGFIAGERNMEGVALVNTGEEIIDGSEATAGKEVENGATTETEFGKINAPGFIRRDMPVYPIMARRLGKEGKVHLKLLIDMNGKLQDVEVVGGDDFGFTEAAVAAVKNSTYSPAYLNGERITVKALLTVRFQLQ